MKKPSLEEVKEYFKGAKKVGWHFESGTIEIKDVNRICQGETVTDSYFYKEDNGLKSTVWDHGLGYAKILEYKDGYTNNPNKTIDKVTIDRLSMVLRLNNIQLCDSILDTVIDAVELIEEKGGQVTLEDIVNLKQREL